MPWCLPSLRRGKSSVSVPAARQQSQPGQLSELRRPSEPDFVSHKMHMPKFYYSPLTRPKEIRVLYFDDTVGRTIDGVLALRIAHVTLDEVKAKPYIYNALSYVWGTDTHDKLIKINGFDFNVTPNLETALRNMSKQPGSCFFWIDAICINQQDDIEKNSQVTMMGEIYAAATLTMVWLGECTPVIAEAIDMLEAAEVAHDKNGRPAIDLNHTVDDLNYKSAWKSVGELLATPWWRRMWVIQEIALGQRAAILCGTKTLMFQRLALGAEFAFTQNRLKDIFPVCENGFTSYWRVQRMMEYRTKRQQGEPILLQELLENNIACEATNPRDMVFSLLGLATDTEGVPELVVDYQIPLEEVYANIVRFHVREYKSLDMICMSTHPKQHQDLPSWAPDFPSLKRTTSSLLATFSRPELVSQYCYAASGTSTPNTDALAHGPGILGVSAIFVDKIAYCGEVCWPGSFTELFECLAQWRWIAGAAIDFRREYIGGGPAIDAFNRTLCGDKARSGLRAPKGWRGLEALEDGMEIPGDFRLGSEIADDVRREAWVGDALQAVALRSHRRRLIITEAGYMGLGPPEAKDGDFVSILLGCSVPVILRPKGEDWWFVGESFVCGIMDGEILNMTDMSSEEAGFSEGELPPKRYHVEKILLV